MDSLRRERRCKASIPPSAASRPSAKAESPEKRSRLKDLCREDKLKVVDLISQLQQEKARSRSALAMRKGDQEKYVEEYHKLKTKYTSLKDDFEMLRQKYDQSLGILRQTREAAKSTHCSFVLPDDVLSPVDRRPTVRPGTSGKRIPASCEAVNQTCDRKASEEVRDLRSMINCLSKSVRKLNDSALRPHDPVVSLRLPVSSPQEDLSDTAHSGVQLQPLNLNVLFEDPDHDERISNVLARARQAASKVARLKATHASPAPQYGDQFYALIQELEQAVAL